MKQIELLEEAQIQFPDDVDRVQKALESTGIMATYRECEKLWQLFSQSVSAQWLTVPSDYEEILNAISPYYKHDD